MITPCQEHHERTGQEWVESAPPLTRRRIQGLATLCTTCPIRDDCLEQGERGALSAQGAYIGPSVGIWGGMFFRPNGYVIDPWGPAKGVMTSVYEYVHWDRCRQAWKAEKEVAGKKTHIGYFLDEDRAGRAVKVWLRHWRRTGEAPQKKLVRHRQVAG